MIIGETTYERFKRMIDSLPESEQANFTSSIIARFAELHDLELRDILLEVYKIYSKLADEDE